MAFVNGYSMAHISDHISAPLLFEQNCNISLIYFGHISPFPI